MKAHRGAGGARGTSRTGEINNHRNTFATKSSTPTSIGEAFRAKRARLRVHKTTVVGQHPPFSGFRVETRQELKCSGRSKDRRPGELSKWYCCRNTNWKM